MLLVIANTSPVRYLVQIGQIDLLVLLFDKIMLPSIVADELRHPSAPAAVQSWMKQLPGLGGTASTCWTPAPMTPHIWTSEWLGAFGKRRWYHSLGSAEV